jgi:hypothetical protein
MSGIVLVRSKLVLSVVTCHIGDMATYSVVFREDRSGYDVLVQDDDGGRHRILGFTTEAAAQAWILDDRRADASARPEGESGSVSG